VSKTLFKHNFGQAVIVYMLGLAAGCGVQELGSAISIYIKISTSVLTR
jgi:hypothetical protein